MSQILRLCCVKFGRGLARFVRKHSPLMYRLFYSRNDEYRLLKGIFGFFYGMTFGMVLYLLILVDLDFPPLQCLAVGFMICLMLAIGNAVSIQIRCISLLAIPSFCGRAGRNVLKAVVIVYIIAGPVRNIADNFQEVVRVFACATTLTYNMSRTRIQLMVRPFQEGILQMRADTGEVKQTLHSVQDMVVPLVQEIEGEAEMSRIKEENDYLDELQGDTKRSDEISAKYQVKPEDAESKRYEKGYEKKLEMRCEEMMSKGAGRCRKAFATAYDRCYEKVTWAAAWLLCWPMKITFVCNIAEAMGGEKTCAAAGELEPGFGEGYAYLKKTRSTFAEGFKAAKIQYKLKPATPQLDFRQATDTADGMTHEFQAKMNVVHTLMMLIKRALAFVFILIILEAQDYHDKFVKDIEFENVYVTQYFRKIDARRRVREDITLLPLKKIELPEFIDPFALLPAKKERINLGTQTVKLLLEMITPAALLLVDRLLFVILDLVGRNAHIDYMQTGSHELSLAVKGTGMIASIVRSVLRGFNVKKRVKRMHSNRACLPQPHPIEMYYYYKIFGTYMGVWLLIFAHCYTQRLRRVICAYFYPRREKKRVLFLYNETLKRRMRSARVLKSRVRRNAREQHLVMDDTVLMGMRIRCPRVFSWLRIFSSARRQCLICKEPEPCRKSQQLKYFHECETPTCHFIYCNVCWWELEQVCYACTTDIGDSDSEEEYEENQIQLND